MTKEELEMLRLLDNIKNEQAFRSKNDKEIEQIEKRIQILTTYNGESHIRENEFRTKLVKQSKEYSRGVWD